MAEADGGGTASEASGAPIGGAGPITGGTRPDRLVVGVTALTVAAVVAVVVVWADRPVVAVALAALVVVLGRLSVIDLRERRLPNRIVGPLAGATVAVVVLHGLVTGDLGRLAPALLAGIGFSAVLLALSLVGQVGMGDIKLAFPLGVVAGWLGGSALPVTPVAAFASSAVVAVAALAAGRGRHHTFPFGPFLALGSVAGIVAAGLA